MFHRARRATQGSGEPGLVKHMIELDNLAAALAGHVGSCRSAEVVCALPIAVESWFRVELITALMDIGVSRQHVNFNFTYPGTRDKADLAVLEPEGSAVFELKSFVCFADAIEKFPKQIARLESLVRRRATDQGIAFCTFCGYTEDRIERLCRGFFAPPWTTTQVRPLLDGQSLRFMFACVRSISSTAPTPT
jgi:hypothetical protein